MIRILATALLALSLTASGAFATSMDDLVLVDGLWHKKFTHVPFTGETDEGLWRATFKNGKKEGPWVMYHGKREDSSGTFRNGAKVSD